MPPANVGNISTASVGRVKVTANNGEKEKMVVVGVVEDLSSEAEAAELSGEETEGKSVELSGAKAGENTPRVFGEKTQKDAAQDFGVEA